MQWYEVGSLMLGLVVGLMLLNVPVALAFLGVNLFAAYFFMRGTPGLEQVINNSANSISNFMLVPVPFFILMGELFFHTGVAIKIFDALDKIFGRVRGRLSYIAVACGTIFASLSGSSISTTAMMGSMMIPEMTRRGYKLHTSIGPIMGSGSLAILIPPSGLTVLLGSVALIDIGGLLIGSVIPGLILACMYIAVIYLQLKIDPTAAPGYDSERMLFRQKLLILVKNLVPFLFVFFIVVGLIVAGIATPTESAAFGVVGILVVAHYFRCLTWTAIRKAVEGTLGISVMVFTIILGSATFSNIMAFSGASSGFIQWAVSFDLSKIMILLAMFAVLLVLGCFIDQVSQIMLTMPIFVPLAHSLGFDMIWFGVIVMLSLEISLITPPFGFILFVIAGVAPPGTRFSEIVSAGLPYIVCALALLILILTWPQLVLYLPSLRN